MCKALDSIAELIQVIYASDDMDIREDLDFLVKRIENIPKYFNSILLMEQKLKLNRFRMDNEDYAVIRYDLDLNRRHLHITMTNSVNQINRLAKFYGLSPVFVYEKEGELDSQCSADREIASNCVFDFCKEVFLNEDESNSAIEFNEIMQKGEIFKDKITIQTLLNYSDHAIIKSSSKRIPA